MNNVRSLRPVRTLVVHTGGIGDFLLCCPTLWRLREDGPVETAGTRARLLLAEVAGITEGTHDLDDIDFHSLFSAPSPRLTRFLEQFDRAIIWMGDDGTIKNACKACGVADLRTFPGLPPSDWAGHAARYYTDCLGIQDLPPLRLPIEPDDGDWDVMIHPGSGSPGKNWPLDRFVELAHRLEDRGRRVCFCLGPAEASVKLASGNNAVASSSLVTLARILAAAKLYIGNDSGITHLAAACGCRTVAVFGPTNPAIWAPEGNHVRVLQADPWPSVPDVLQAALIGWNR